MKKRISIGLACVLAVSMTMGAPTLVSGAAGYDGVDGYAKVWDFESWEVGPVAHANGNTTVSPINWFTDGYNVAITDEWNYLGGQGKSIRVDSEEARDGCIIVNHPNTIAFKDTAYNALVFAVKVPEAPAAGANEKGYSIGITFNDWGTYYSPKNSADTFRIQKKGSPYWEDVAVQESLYVPYGFEGLVKIDMAAFYKTNAFPTDPEDENYAADVEASRLKDKEIQHEVGIEVWLPNTTGGAQGAFYMDDIYLRTPEATDVDEREPVEPEKGPREFCDFESYAVGDVLYDPNTQNGSAVWTGYGHTVTASDKFVGNGKISAEFSSEENRQTWGIMTILKAGDGNVKDKKYLVMHIATPSADSSKSAAFADAQGNRRFAFSILPKTEENGAGHWFKINTTVAGNVKMLPDGEATWKQIPGDESHNYLPFGWSGWILYDLSAFSEGSLKLDGSTPITGIEVYTSQCGGRFGKVYLDSVFMMDDEDELPGGISAKGNKNGTDPVTPPTSEQPTDPPFIPDLSDPITGDPTTGNGATDPASDGGTTGTQGGSAPTGVPFNALPLLLMLTASGLAIGCRRLGGKKA